MRGRQMKLWTPFQCLFVTSIFTGCITGLPADRTIPPDVFLAINAEIDSLVAYTSGQDVPLELSDAAAQTEKIREVAESLRALYPELRTMLLQQALAETNRGRVTLVDSPVLEDSEIKNRTQRLSASVNDLRKELHSLMARRFNEYELSVRSIHHNFVHARLAQAAHGCVYQLPEEEAEYAIFLKSPAAARFGAKVEPGAWLAAP